MNPGKGDQDGTELGSISELSGSGAALHLAVFGAVFLGLATSACPLARQDDRRIIGQVVLSSGARLVCALVRVHLIIHVTFRDHARSAGVRGWDSVVMIGCRVEVGTRGSIEHVFPLHSIALILQGMHGTNLLSSSLCKLCGLSSCFLHLRFIHWCQ